MRPGGVALLVLGVVAPSLALAQRAEDALLRECFEQRQAGRHAASLPACERAVTVAPSGRSLAQLGLTEMALERWADAATHLAAALDDTAHPWIQQNRAAVEGALRAVRARVGVIDVSTNVPGATASLGGAPGLPVPHLLYGAPGAASLTLRAPNGRSTSRDLTLAAGEVTRAHIEFPAAAAPTVTPPAREAVSSRAMPVATPPPTPTATNSVSVRRVLAFTAGGLAVAGFGLALASWQLREGVVDAYKARGCPTEDTTDRTLYDACTSAHREAEGERDQWEALTAVGLAAGGAFAITSVILFATEPSRRAPATSWTCAPSLGLAGGNCVVRF